MIVCYIQRTKSEGGIVMCMINVLWITNNSNAYAFLESETEFSVKLCDSVSQCVEILKHEKGVWDAVLISDICKSKPDSIARVDNISDANNEIRKFEIPYFFITERVKFSVYDEMVFEFILKGKRPYHIKNDKQALVTTLKEDVKSLPVSKIKAKYLTVCNFIDDPVKLNYLTSLLIRLEANDETLESDSSIGLPVRKVLEWLKKDSKYMKDKKVGDFDVKLQSHDTFSINDSMSKLSWNNFSLTFTRSNKVPEYIKRSMHACIRIANEMDHGYDLDKLVSTNYAPYVTRALIYELLNILYWCALQNQKEA